MNAEKCKQIIKSALQVIADSPDHVDQQDAREALAFIKRVEAGTNIREDFEKAYQEKTGCRNFRRGVAGASWTYYMEPQTENAFVGYCIARGVNYRDVP